MNSFHSSPKGSERGDVGSDTYGALVELDGGNDGLQSANSVSSKRDGGKNDIEAANVGIDSIEGRVAEPWVRKNSCTRSPPQRLK